MKGVIYFTKIRDEYAGKNMEHMIGEKLLEQAIKKEYNIRLAYEPRALGEHGKPFFTLRPTIHYNISHSGEYVMCILAPRTVGIDVQIHKEVNMERMLKRMVTPELAAEILESDNVKERFFEQWVLREAYIKSTGEGLSRDLRTIPFDRGYHQLLDFKKGYSAAVWSTVPMEIRWEQVDVILN